MTTWVDLDATPQEGSELSAAIARNCTCTYDEGRGEVTCDLHKSLLEASFLRHLLHGRRMWRRWWEGEWNAEVHEDAPS